MQQTEHHQHQVATTAATAISTSTPPPPPSTTGGFTDEAPPKQVAIAMDKLGQAERIIADIRIGADRLLEALFITAGQHQQGNNKPVEVFVKEHETMQRHFQDLRSLGKELEEAAVLSEAARSRKDVWGLDMPLVCPDGAVVAYAWKRQLAAQAGASATDRSRLALKAFTDQKRRFFPHLEDGIETNESGSKKHCGSEEVAFDPKEAMSFLRTLPDVLKSLEKDVPNVKISTFERLDWLKYSSTLTSSSNESSEEPNYRGSNKRRLGSVVVPERIAVIELLYPSIFRAVISLHPAGSTNPDAVAFFSPDECGSYVHATGLSVHHVYRHITEYATIAVQYFLGTQPETSLYSLLHWICSYQTLFSKPCRKCSKLLAMDKQVNLLLLPVHRPYWKFYFAKILSTISSKDQNSDTTMAYHIGCLSEEI